MKTLIFILLFATSISAQELPEHIRGRSISGGLMTSYSPPYYPGNAENWWEITEPSSSIWGWRIFFEGTERSLYWDNDEIIHENLLGRRKELEDFITYQMPRFEIDEAMYMGRASKKVMNRLRSFKYREEATIPYEIFQGRIDDTIKSGRLALQRILTPRAFKLLEEHVAHQMNPPSFPIELTQKELEDWKEFFRQVYYGLFFGEDGTEQRRPIQENLVEYQNFIMPRMTVPEMEIVGRYASFFMSDYLYTIDDESMTRPPMTLRLNVERNLMQIAKRLSPEACATLENYVKFNIAPYDWN